MSNTLYYKFKGLGKILKNSSACVTHLYSTQRWKYVSPFVYAETGEYVDKDKLDLSLDALEWIEYRITGSRDHKNYYHFRERLRHSRMKPVLKFLKADYSVRYRFTKNTPRAQVIFVVSNMRYWEENQDRVERFLRKGKKIEDSDLWFAAFSTDMLPMSGHAVYKPFNALKGLAHYLDKYVPVMLKGDQVKLTEMVNIHGIRGYPSAVTKKFFETVEGDEAVPYAGYGDYGDTPPLKGILEHFHSTDYKLPEEAA